MLDSSSLDHEWSTETGKGHTGPRLHAVQYFIMGLALCVFYLLLLAFSEHLAFGVAYLIAASALTALLGIYLAGALRSGRAGTLAASTIASVCGLLYLLVLTEQYALLLGRCWCSPCWRRSSS